MDRGNLPGFWYDEEKKKYFKIQADHQLPSKAQYSHSKVKRQRRKAKQQKAARSKRPARDQQTVRRSKLLDDPCVGGIGLRRELGNLTTGFALHLSDATIVSHWSATGVRFRKEQDGSMISPLLDTEYLPDTRRLLTVELVLESPTTGYGISFEPERTYRLSSWDIDWLQKSSSHATDDPGQCGNSEFTYQYGVSGSWIGCHTPGTVIFGGEVAGVCNTRKTDNMFDIICQSPFMLKLSSLSDISMHKSTHYLAVREYAHLAIFDQDLKSITRIRLARWTSEGEPDSEQFCPTIDWLDAQTVVYGDNGSFGRPAVLLWNIRSSSSQVVRFTLRHRITGILTADDSGCRIFVSTNYHIYLFDTRHAREEYDPRALMKIPHVHEGPQCQMATNKLGLLAAVDRDNVVQVYSTWTRNRIGSLKMPCYYTPNSEFYESLPFRRLKWYDGGLEGPGLTACQGGSVVRWNWQKLAMKEGEELEDG